MGPIAKRQLEKARSLVGEGQLDEAREIIEALLPKLQHSSASGQFKQAKDLLLELANHFGENDRDLDAASCFESASKLSAASSEQARLLDLAAISYGFAEEYGLAIQCEEMAISTIGDGLKQSSLYPIAYHRLGRWCRLAGRTKYSDSIKWYSLFLKSSDGCEHNRLLEQLAHEDIADSLVDCSNLQGQTSVRIEGMGVFSYENECHYAKAIQHYHRAFELINKEDVEGALRLSSAITNCYFFEDTRLTIMLNDLPKGLRNEKRVKPLIDLLLKAVEHKENEIRLKSDAGYGASDDDLLDLAMLAGEAAYLSAQFGSWVQQEMHIPRVLGQMMSNKQTVSVSVTTGNASNRKDDSSIDKPDYTSVALDMTDRAMSIWKTLFDKQVPLLAPQYEKKSADGIEQEARWVLDQNARRKAAAMRSLEERGSITRKGTAPPMHFKNHFRAFGDSYRAVRAGEKTWTDVDIEICPLLLAESIAQGGPDCDEAQGYRNSLGWAWFRHGDYVKALFYFESQFRIELHKGGFRGFDNEHLLKAMLRTLGRLGRYREAIELAVLRIQMKGWDGETASYLAMLLIEVGEKRTSQALVEWLLKNTQSAASWPELLMYLAVQVDPVRAKKIASEILSGNEMLYGLIALSPTKHAAPYLICMGCANYIRGQYKEALEYYDGALAIAAEECGYGYYDLGTVYLHLLSIAMMIGVDEVPDTGEYVNRALEFVKEQAALAFEIVDEELRYRYLETCRHIVSLCNSLAVENPLLFTNARISTWLAMFSNMCNSATYYQSRFSTTGEKAYKQKHRLWLDTRQKEAAEHCGYLLDSYTSEIGNRRFEAESELVHCLTAGQEIFRKHVEDRSRTGVTPGTALLEFGSFFYTDGYYADGGTVRNTAGMVPHDGFPYASHYYVSIRTGLESKVIYLHECETINEHVQRLRDAVVAGGPVDEDVDFLRARLIAPIEPFLGDAARLCIVPEGTLCTLPFELLQRTNPLNSFDLAAISYLFSIDQQSADFEKRHYSSAAIFSNPSFALDGNVAGLIAERPSYLAHRDSTIGANAEEILPSPALSIKRDMDDLIPTAQIISLPWTEVEAAIIQNTLLDKGTAVEVFEKESACKRSFAIKRPAITHVATHGFAFDEVAIDTEAQSKKWSAYCTIKKNADSDGTHPEINRETFAEEDAVSPFQHARDPMMRCGLVLSGASDFLRGRTTPDYIGDGIVTGSEILTMDYSQVELAVLASCKSALGETRNGEGIQGLRKAFDAAGVGKLICALWDVDDFSSSIFMGLFYERLASGKYDVAMSLQLAKNALRVLSYEEAFEYVDRLYEDGLESLALDAESRLRTIRSRNPDAAPFASPYHWAGYVCVERLVV